MSQKISHQQILRAIGQALEAQDIHSFELNNQGNRYLVRGRAQKPRSFVSAFRQWRRQSGGSPSPVLNYTFQDLERLEHQGRMKRAAPDRLPDFYSLSNTLRTVGFYLDSKGASLLEIHKTPLQVMILYADQDGHPRVEERKIASFYDLFIRLHGKRAVRAPR